MQPQLSRKHLASYITAVLLCCTCADENKEAVKAKEGATVTLQTRDTIHNINTQIVWTFGPENPNMRIATVKKREARSDYVERFRDRLQLDSLTGALTITQLRVTDSGVYMWQSISSNILSQNLHLSVYSSVTPPFITVNTSLVNMSCSSVILQCSAENTREMTLAWYRGRDRVKNISSPDLSFRLSLPLEIESHDGDNYSCVAENPVDEKATTLHTEDTCLKTGESSSWCQSEVTVRLVISAVVGMTLIILVVDHIRIRR